MGSTNWLLKSLFVTLGMVVASFMPWVRVNTGLTEQIDIVAPTMNAWHTRLVLEIADQSFVLPNWLPAAISIVVLLNCLFFWLDVRALRSISVLMLSAYGFAHTLVFLIFMLNQDAAARPEGVFGFLTADTKPGTGAYLTLAFTAYYFVSLMAMLVTSRSRTGEAKAFIETTPQVPGMTAS